MISKNTLSYEDTPLAFACVRRSRIWNETGNLDLSTSSVGIVVERDSSIVPLSQFRYKVHFHIRPKINTNIRILGINRIELIEIGVM